MAPVGESYRPVRRSELWTPTAARRVGPVESTEILTTRTCLPERSDTPPLPDHEHWMAKPPGHRRFLSSKEFAARHGLQRMMLPP